AFSCFLARKDMYLAVGPFDPVYTPCYWDDVDWAYRAMVLGLYQIMVVEAATFEHVGSATMKAEDPSRHNASFVRNQRYYFANWGGRRGDEPFKTPFDGETPWIPPFVR